MYNNTTTMMNEKTYALSEINALMASGKYDQAMRLYDEVVDYKTREEPRRRETFISKFITKMGL